MSRLLPWCYITVSQSLWYFSETIIVNCQIYLVSLHIFVSQKQYSTVSHFLWTRCKYFFLHFFMRLSPVIFIILMVFWLGSLRGASNSCSHSERCSSGSDQNKEIRTYYSYTLYLHWLPVSERIDCKIILQAYKSLKHFGPVYNKEMRREYQPGGD